MSFIDPDFWRDVSLLKSILARHLKISFQPWSDSRRCKSKCADFKRASDAAAVEKLGGGELYRKMA
jgi:hypothetical protein